MTHWHDTMVDRPDERDPAYAIGWVISALVVLAAVVGVWLLGI